VGRVCRIAHWATLLGPSGPPARRWVTRTRPSGPEKARATALPIPIFVICLAALAIPTKCGTNDLAALLGVTVRRVTQLVEKKVLLGEARGSFATACIGLLLTAKLSLRRSMVLVRMGERGRSKQCR
jgi:hypothetical protein